MQNFIFSVKPKYCELIFNGEKIVELRKTNVHISQGDRIIIYASAPTKAIVGSAIVRSSNWMSIANLWKATNQICGLEEKDFFSYFTSKSHGCGIWLKEVREMITPITLGELQYGLPSWKPPQSYRLLKPEESKILAFMGLS